jgi:hypothetical protein
MIEPYYAWVEECHTCNTCGRDEVVGQTFGDGPDGLLECPDCRDERMASEEASETHERSLT